MFPRAAWRLDAILLLLACAGHARRVQPTLKPLTGGESSPLQGLQELLRASEPAVAALGWQNPRFQRNSLTLPQGKPQLSELASPILQLRGGQNASTEGEEPETPAEVRHERPSWQARLKCYSIASVARREGRKGWNEVTQGNKVVLPYTVLDYLQSRKLPFDKFQLLNPAKRGLRLFTGPLDFCAPPGECYLPSWVMKQLGIQEGDVCAVATAHFPACAFVKFQPHTSDFLDIGNHYLVLTQAMENMGGLTQGAYIRISDGKKTYTLDVLEVKGKPAERDDSNGKGVAIGTFECPVEFAEPKDIAKKKKKQQQEQQEKQEATEESKEGSNSEEKPGSEQTRAPPVPKFKLRKEAEARGETFTDENSPFVGRARTMGSKTSAADGTEEDVSEAQPKSELAKLRAAAKAAKEAEEAESKQNFVEVIKTNIATLVRQAWELVTPGDVNFD